MRLNFSIFLLNKRLGEVPYACVVGMESGRKSPSAIELKNYLKERLALFKILEEILFVDTLPKTASGKLIRRN